MGGEGAEEGETHWPEQIGFATADDHVGSGRLGLGEHLGHDFRWVLQIPIHDAQPFAAHGLKAFDNGAAEAVAPFGRPGDEAHGEGEVGYGGRDNGGRVVAAIVYEQHFKRDARQGTAEPFQQRPNVARFVHGGHDDGEGGRLIHRGEL